MNAGKIKSTLKESEAQLAAQAERVAAAEAAVSKAKADLAADINADRDYSKSEAALTAATTKLSTVTVSAQLAAEAVELKRKALADRLRRERVEALRSVVPGVHEALARAHADAVTLGAKLADAVSERDRAAGSLQLLASAHRALGEPEPVCPTPDLDADISEVFRGRHAKANVRDGWTPPFGSVEVSIPVLVAAHSAVGFLAPVVEALEADRVASSLAVELAD
jgi:hypothetical protein